VNKQSIWAGQCLSTVEPQSKLVLETLSLDVLTTGIEDHYKVSNVINFVMIFGRGRVSRIKVFLGHIVVRPDNAIGLTPFATATMPKSRGV
jgi:hypothetical protein